MADDRETIQSRMLSNISDEYDKADGSFFYDPVKAVSIELEEAFKSQDEDLDKAFALTATGEWLDKKVAERGLTRKAATKATTTVLITGTAGAAINAGDKVASDTVSFIIVEDKIIDATLQATVKVECEEVGPVGNVPAGAIKYFPVTLSGLTTVNNLEPVTNGYNEETNEELKERYFEVIRTPATSGNIYHYRNWAKEVTGVGDIKVFPLWNGNGTVKVVLIDSNNQPASAELVTDVSGHIEEERPIGATVTVESAAGEQINVSFTAVKDPNIDDVTRQANVEESITNYLSTLGLSDDRYVSYALIGDAILSSTGILDYSNLLVNNGTANVVLSNVAELCEVAVLGTVTIS